MIDIRPSCENCNTGLLANNPKAMICAFECTFCENCVNNVLHNVCPNCGGGFEKRPLLPKRWLEKYPPRGKVTFNPVDMEKFMPLLEANKGVASKDRLMALLFIVDVDTWRGSLEGRLDIFICDSPQLQ